MSKNYKAEKIFNLESGTRPENRKYAFAPGAGTATITSMWTLSVFRFQTRDDYKLRTTLVATPTEGNSAVLEVFSSKDMKWNELMRLSGAAVPLKIMQTSDGSIHVDNKVVVEEELMRIAYLTLYT
jgi:hypothetical protein